MIIAGIYQGLRANASIIEDGVVKVAVEKERLTRIKHDSGNIDNCLSACCSSIGISINDIDVLAFVGASEDDYPYGYHQVMFKSDTIIDGAFKQFLFPQEVTREWQISLSGRTIPGYVVDHHIAHASAAFFTSTYEDSLVLSYDGWGDFRRNCLVAIGNRNSLTPLSFVDLPIGLAYKKISKDLFALRGHKFDVPGKLMALAALGQPRDVDAMKKFIMKINNRTNFYDYIVSGFGPLKFMIFENWEEKESQDFASTFQAGCEELIIELLETWKIKTGAVNLCIAGGCAQNILINSKIVKSGMFKKIYVVPCSHDGGLGIGAAMYTSHSIFGEHRRESPGLPYFGANSKYTADKISKILSRLKYCRITTHYNLGYMVAEFLSKGAIVALFQGRSEAGPRALGNRSILADPRMVSARDKINKVKKREKFRPYAASILEEHMHEYLDWEVPSPYMTFSIPVKMERRSEIPAVVHNDGTCRAQTVNLDQNKLLFEILTSFAAITGVPVLLNTSLNTAGEPIAENVFDAIKIFESNDIDILVVNEFMVEKEDFHA